MGLQFEPQDQVTAPGGLAAEPQPVAAAAAFGNGDGYAFAVQLDGGLAAVERLQQVQLQLSFDRPGYRLALAASEELVACAGLEAEAGAASTERAAEQALEEVTEAVQVFGVHALETGLLACGTCERHPAAFAAELVVEAALLFVVQDGVGLVDLLEPLLGGRIIGVAVRVIGSSQLAEGAAYLLLRGGPGYAQYVVIVLVLCQLPSPPPHRSEEHTSELQ